MHKLRIIRQPDGKLALWDTENCRFLVMAARDNDLLEFIVKKQVEEIKKLAERELKWFKENEKKKEKGERVPNYFMTFKDALEQLEIVHGKEEREKIWFYVGNIKGEKIVS